jgi:hypothetical protein
LPPYRLEASQWKLANYLGDPVATSLMGHIRTKRLSCIVVGSGCLDAVRKIDESFVAE